MNTINLPRNYAQNVDKILNYKSKKKRIILQEESHKGFRKSYR